MDSNSLLALFGGATGVGGLMFGFFRWSLARNVEAEDGFKVSTSKSIETLRTDIISHEKDNASKFRALEMSINEIRTEHARLGTELSGAVASVNQLHGAVDELKRSIELTRDKQTQAWRDSLRELSDDLRDEIDRMADPSPSAPRPRPRHRRSRG